MIYTYQDFLQYVPDLKRYVKSKIKDSYWEDIIQETLLQLFVQFNKVVTTDNPKAIVINTANFFIYKYFRNKKIEYSDDIDMKYMYAITDSLNPVFKIGYWNSYNVDDNLISNLETVSKTLYEPFEMQLNNKSIKEIADELQINENTVKTRIKRCKEYLKQGL